MSNDCRPDQEAARAARRSTQYLVSVAPIHPPILARLIIHIMTQHPQPSTAQHWLAEGAACVARADLEGALRCFETARSLSPGDTSAHEKIGATLTALNRGPEALQCYTEALALDPHNSIFHHNIGWIHEGKQRLEEAVACYREAVRLNPQNDGSYNNIGNCLQALGRFDEAHDAYRRAIEVAPRMPLYYRNFVQSKRLSADDPVFVALEQLVNDAGSMTPAEQAELHFAYGQALAELDRRDLSFDHFLQGNALQRVNVRYDEAATLRLFDDLPTLFTADLMAAKRGLGDASDAPVFIVGMPRSGSTLIEQILASHPGVVGTGERIEFSEALVGLIRREATDPLRVVIGAPAQLNAAQLGALGADYLQRMQDAVPDAFKAVPSGAASDASGGSAPTHFTDKYPFNFINIGLIHLALPNARFIHSRRSPVQTCLSIFSRLFYDVPFSYDLGELGRYYRAYDALMAHWHRVLPEGVMIDVQYEDLVDDFETHVRRMLDHCGLAWDERCLAFHQTRRTVATASSAQVRRPLYKTSLQRWQPQRALLQPLYDGLGAALSGESA